MSETRKKLARIVARKTESDISAEMLDGTLVRTLALNGMSTLDLSEAIEREFKTKIAPARLTNMTLAQVADTIDVREVAVASCDKPGCTRPATTIVSGKGYCDAHLAELRAPAKPKEKAA